MLTDTVQQRKGAAKVADGDRAANEAPLLAGKGATGGVTAASSTVSSSVMRRGRALQRARRVDHYSDERQLL